MGDDTTILTKRYRSTDFKMSFFQLLQDGPAPNCIGFKSPGICQFTYTAVAWPAKPRLITMSDKIIQKRICNARKCCIGDKEIPATLPCWLPMRFVRSAQMLICR